MTVRKQQTDLDVWRKIQTAMTAEALGLTQAAWRAYCDRMEKRLADAPSASENHHLILHIDGAARGNPGPAAIGVVVMDASRQPLQEVSRCIGSTTNNVAEYQALIAALEVAAELGGEELSIYSDSELLVRQMNGEYRVKNAQLVELYREAQVLLHPFKACTIAHVPRQQNRRADQLANLALDASV